MVLCSRKRLAQSLYFIYCNEIEKWVFRHEYIRTSFGEDNEVMATWKCFKVSFWHHCREMCSPSFTHAFIFYFQCQNECDWLPVSPDTEGYDIIHNWSFRQWHLENVDWKNKKPTISFATSEIVLYINSQFVLNQLQQVPQRVGRWL